MSPCQTCRGKKHLFDHATRLWSPCACVKEAKEKASQALVGEAKLPAAFGTAFAKFVMQAIDFPGPSWLSAPLPWLHEAAVSAIGAALNDGKTARLYRLEEVVDAAFKDRGDKAAFDDCVERRGFVAIVCGDEPPHKWNGQRLLKVVLQRRYAKKPTLIAAIGDLVALYGESAEAVFRGLSRYPSLKLRITEAQ